MKFTKKSIYIGLFSILYLIVAFSSFFHAVSFFGLANNSWMSIILAFAFEVGQAAVLFSLLTSTKDRSRVMPWVLMVMFTLVQVIGNVYSSYKYIITNSVDNLRFFKEPIFIWTELPDAQANVIIVYLVGAILPIAALLLTSMITNYLTDQEEINKQLENKNEELSNNDNEQQSDRIPENQKFTESENNKDREEIEKLKQELETERSVHQDISKDYPKVVEESNKKDEEIEKLKQEIEQLKHPQINRIQSDEIIQVQPMNEPEELKKIKENENNKSDIEQETIEEKPINTEILEDEHDPDIADKSKLEDIGETEDQNIEEHKRQSHFINL